MRMSRRIRAAWRVLTARRPRVSTSGHIETRDDGTTWLVTDGSNGQTTVRLA